MHDIAIIGGGPAGMTAALYGLRNGKSVVVFEKNGFGGQMTSSPKIENYPGYRQVSGNELADTMLDQILAQGAEIEFSEVMGVRESGDHKTVVTEDGACDARSVVIATGVKHRMLGLDGEEGLVGDGISFCAVCDGDFYAGKDVCVIGGGNSALQEAVLLAEKCSKVTIVQDLPQLTGEARLRENLVARDNVEVITGQEVTSLLKGNGGFEGIEIRDQESGKERALRCDGMFVAIGLIPENNCFGDIAVLDGYGYFDSDEGCSTKTGGVFVAGDCRRKNIRQITTAMADGATAALAACRYVDGL